MEQKVAGNHGELRPLIPKTCHIAAGRFAGAFRSSARTGGAGGMLEPDGYNVTDGQRIRTPAPSLLPMPCRHYLHVPVF